MKYFYINNKKINYVPANRSIIEYCESIGVTIPHYCYHPNLSIAGNCRMCLVEVKGSPKPVISCAMSLMNKMEIYTDSPLVKKSRESVLEFLLLNHPLDCPVCDQGGECDLQDQSFVFGTNKKRFFSFKRIVINKNIGPLIKTVMTRCIHCTRCVRFSSEIAGTNQLGVFGRGNNSEIGTYVTNVFSSELSGNVIDICPVGALTSKQYPFVGRIWELKTINSVDYSDSSVINIQIYIKGNSIVKILPGYSNKNYENSWISDKTRFSFDGMFSPERILTCTVSNGNKNSSNIEQNWSEILKNVLYILYFQNHLLKHEIKQFKLLFVFNENLDIESLVMLMLLSKKYPFINIRKSSLKKFQEDFEYNFTINSFDKNKISKSDLCILFNINTRYENPEINLKLRQNLLKGGLKIISINSFIDFTYPIKNLGSNTSVLKEIIEGNHTACQEFSISSKPIFLTSSELFNREDSKSLYSLFEILCEITNLQSKNWNGFNLCTTSMNEVGLNSLNSFKSLKFSDISDSSSIIFINNDFSELNIKKIIELKLLNYFNIEIKNKSIIEIHNIFKDNFLVKTKKNYNSSIYVSLPNKVFFEDSFIIQNNSGSINKTVKALNSLNKSKSNWKILRKLYSYLNKNIYNSYNTNLLEIVNLNNYNIFLKFIEYNYLPSLSISNNNSLTLVKNISQFVTKTNNKYKFSKKKFINSKTVLWLDDFYLGGKDLYSKFSLVMSECSKSFRSESTNFKFII